MNINTDKPVRLLLTRLVLISLVLRIAVPAGLMPAAADSWFLQICPDGLPARVAAVLSGHNHHHNHAEAADSYNDCNLAAFAAEVAAPPVELILSADVSSTAPPVSRKSRAVSTRGPLPVARAPPQLSLA